MVCSCFVFTFNILFENSNSIFLFVLSFKVRNRETSKIHLKMHSVKMTSFTASLKMETNEMRSLTLRVKNKGKLRYLVLRLQTMMASWNSVIMPMDVSLVKIWKYAITLQY